jgi:hypothetical protein
MEKMEKKRREKEDDIKLMTQKIMKKTGEKTIGGKEKRKEEKEGNQNVSVFHSFFPKITRFRKRIV